MYNDHRILDRKVQGLELLVTIEWKHEPSFFGKLLGRRATYDKGTYIGSGIVWYRLPSYMPVTEVAVAEKLRSIWYADR